MSVVEYISLGYWICCIILGICSTMVTGTIFRRETMQRISGSSRYMQFSSRVSLCCGAMATMMLSLNVLPGLCLLKSFANATLFTLQYVFMGMYQLSVLHYSFSRSQIHHRKGYPLCVFIIMICIGITVLISAVILFSLAMTLPSECGYTSKYQFYWKYSTRSFIFHGDPRSDVYFNMIWHLWHFAVSTAGQIWDITTLLLYSFKIWSFHKLYNRKDDGVLTKIQLILFRVVIVTVFYQLSSLILVVVYGMESVLDDIPWPSLMHFIRNQLVPAMFSILMSFCMMLMMDHNTDFYVRFLRFLHLSCLDSICFCCCRRIVALQLEEYSEHGTSIRMGKIPSASSTSPTTKVLSIDQMKKPSIETMTLSNISKGVEYKSGRNAAPSLDTVTEINPYPNSVPLQPSICAIVIEEDEEVEMEYDLHEEVTV